MNTFSRRHFLLAAGGGALASTTVACAEKARVVRDTSLPNGPFGAKSTAEEVTAGIDLGGKVALVTGGTSGLGLETLRVLALRDARVIATGRTLEKAREACAGVDGDTVPVALELADLSSIAACAESVRALGVPLDILVCNAGINTFGELELVNGVESMFAVNFLGHFALVHELLPLLHAAPTARIVHVGSRSGYRQAPPQGIDFDNLRGEKTFDAGEAYGRSKLANALFSLELARRLQETSVTSNVIHPGLVTTNIARTAPRLVQAAFDLLGPLFAKSVEQGAATQCYVATAPALAGVSGAYFEDCNPVRIEGPNHVFDAPMAARLWDTAEKMLAAARAGRRGF
jgi:NAD(P)-dependent dehydrogenase (short-subunit alcohol dehydrogenase family)